MKNNIYIKISEDYRSLMNKKKVSKEDRKKANALYKLVTNMKLSDKEIEIEYNKINRPKTKLTLVKELK